MIEHFIGYLLLSCFILAMWTIIDDPNDNFIRDLMAPRRRQKRGKK